MKLQSPVNKTIITSVGYTFAFKADVPKNIPPLAVQECLAAGCHLVEGEKLTVGEKKEVTALQGPEREDAICEAIKTLVARNERDDFTGAGKPDATKLSSLVGFVVYAAERDTLWVKTAAEIGDE